MKITDVQTIPLSVPIPEEHRWTSSMGYSIKRDMILVKILTDEGVVGWGDSNHGTNPSSVVMTIEDKFKPLLLGEDPFMIEKLVTKMRKSSRMLGSKGIVPLAISGVEIALWDIVGKTLNTPVYKLLGGFRDRVPAYAGGLALGWKEPAVLAQEAFEHVKNGFKAIKIRIGQGPEKDLRCVAAVREAIGNDIQLMVDANGGYDRLGALKMARGLEEYDVYWFEEPLPEYDIPGLAELAHNVDIAIAAGENEYLVGGFRELLSVGAVDIAQPDVSKCGGILEGKHIAAMARANNIPCIPHVFGTAVCMAANLQLLASISNAPIMEFDVSGFNPFRDDIVQEPLKVEEGFVDVPQKPGIGVEIKEDILKEFPFIKGSSYINK